MRLLPILLSLMPIIGSAQSYSTIVISPSLPQCTALEVCPNDTLRFVGDSTNSNFYGTVEGWVYNSLSQSNDYFTITSHNSIETSYEHVVVQGDSSYYWEWCMYGNFPPPHENVRVSCRNPGLSILSARTETPFFA